MQIRADQVMYPLVRVSDVARQLLNIEPIGQKRKRNWFVVARLELESLVIDRAAVQPRRGTGFKPCEAKTEAHECGANSASRTFSGSSAWRLGFASVHEGLEKC